MEEKMSNLRTNYKCDIHGHTTFFTVKEMTYKKCGSIAIVIYAFCLRCNTHCTIKEVDDDVPTTPRA
jgi:hypothetical protein